MFGVLRGDGEAVGVLVVVEVEERAAAPFDLDGSAEQTGGRVFGETNDDPAPLALYIGGRAAERAVAVELRGELTRAEAAGARGHH